MGWLDSILDTTPGGWLSVAGGALSAYGALKGGSDSASYYSALAAIDRQNAAIQKQNTDLSISEKTATAGWNLQAADINLANAGYQEDYDTIVAENEKGYNYYMSALTRNQEAETIDVATGLKAGEEDVAQKTEALSQTTATQTYDEKMDTLRHVVAETAAKGGASGFNVNAGSFMSALNDEVRLGDISNTSTMQNAFASAALQKESSDLTSEANYKNRMIAAQGMEGTALKYDLSGKINLEQEKLASEIYGSAEDKYGISKEQYDYSMDEAKTMGILNTQQYGVNMDRANLTEKQGANAQTSSYWAGGGALVSSFAKAYYGIRI